VAVVLGLLFGIKKAAIARRGPVGTAQSIRMSFQSWSALMTRPDTQLTTPGTNAYGIGFLRDSQAWGYV
jgi:hypothetical protein